MKQLLDEEKFVDRSSNTPLSVFRGHQAHCVDQIQSVHVHLALYYHFQTDRYNVTQINVLSGQNPVD
jgi:hypothetical protein